MRRFLRTGSRFSLRPVAAVVVLALLLLLVGCSTGDPQNTFSPAGDVAKDQRDLLNLVLWLAGVILVLVEGLLIFALIRFRRKRDDALPQQVHGNTGLEIAWAIAPAVLLLVIAVPMVGLIVDLGRAPAEDALHIRVTGRQWAWEFEYLDPEYEVAQGNPECVAAQLRTAEDAGGQPLCVGNVLHVPVGREIAVEVESIDVVHSFWVPRLAGKLDAIPGRTNRMWFNATEPGSFSGQCAEFCGLGHAEMRFVIMAQTEEEFQQWVNEQLGEQQAGSSGSGEPRVASGGE